MAPNVGSAEMLSVVDVNRALRGLPIGSVAFANPDIRKYFADSTRSVDDEDWLSKPEFPSSEEIAGTDTSSDDDCVDLIPNNVVGSWTSKDFYLKSHYELLREDAVAPLRDTVAYVRDDPTMMDSKTVSIYEKVHIVGITFAQRGLAFRVQFSTNRAGKNIVWEYSKRLINGTVVALSPARDSFQRECIIAVVAARPLKGVKAQPAEVDLYFARAEDAFFDPQQEWIMVESKSGYYESVRHTMTALQKMAKEEFPLQGHICHIDPEIGAPDYVKENPVARVQSAFQTSTVDGKINLLEDWPKLPSFNDLDDSQCDALKRILTKKLAIVQGPPGTGKTHVSVVALKVMLDNMQPGDPPVIIAAQTNHALDQLLTHVSCFERNFIRLGARSSDVEIKKRTLFAINQREPVMSLQGGALAPAQKNLKILSRSILQLLEAFNQDYAGAPLSSSFFLQHGLLSQTQYDSLKSGAKEWTRTGSDEIFDPIVTWLDDEVMNFDVTYANEIFGLVEDEVDLEYEQLKELEAEQGFDDEDYETLKGQFAVIREGACGRDAVSYSEQAISGYLKSHDMWKIPSKARGAVYNTLRNSAKTKILSSFRKLVKLYNRNCCELQIGKWERDYIILQNAKVVGMTTTGLSKHRGLVSSLKPKIIMIEEAAETIEAPVSVSCVESLQHLILVGDHKQLKGHCTLQELEGKPFFLDVSMFERLVNNGIGYTTLTRQRRMAPEIRKLLTPIYGELQDHPSVQNRPGIPGMGNIRSFFFSHSWPESRDSLSSKYNEMEANMIIGHFLHLVLNGVAASDITVLTFYNGQRKRLLRLLRNHSYLQGNCFKVVTVDSYQGEENEVVILSLVRSSEHGNIGFLSVENRVCVALSRAKRGCYIFGNAKSLASENPLWREIVCMMKKGTPNNRRLGSNLPLKCSKHGNNIYIRHPAQWATINGGCRLFCNEKLRCGHKCSHRCHSFEHDQVSCDKICGKTVSCGHKCGQPCSDSHHICSCKCELGRQYGVVNSASVFEIETTPNSHVADENYSMSQEGDGPLDSAQVYRNFADGGAKEQDKMLFAKAMGTEAFVDLLDEDNNLEGRSPPDAVSGAATAPWQTNIDGDKPFSANDLDFFDNPAAGPAAEATSNPRSQNPAEEDLLFFGDDD